MIITFRISQALLKVIHDDLDRPHQFAAERVGFVACNFKKAANGNSEFTASNYYPVADEHYVDNPRVGAMMGPSAIRTALQLAYQNPVSMFHIHRHDHRGTPRFSPVDGRENSRFIPDFWKVRGHQPHGAIVLSLSSMFGMCWIQPGQLPVPITRFEIQAAHAPNLRGIV